MKDKSILIRILFVFVLFIAQIRSFCTRIVFLGQTVTIIEKVLFAIIVIISIINLLSFRIKTKEFYIVFSLAIISIISYAITKSLTLPYLLLMPLASKTIAFDKIIKVDLIAKMSITIIVIICFFLGLTESDIVFRNGAARASLGFPHPNTLGFACMIMVLDALYLLRTKTSILMRLFTVVVPLYLCVLADSRTSQVMIIISLFLSIISLIRRKRGLTVSMNAKNKIANIAFLLPLILIAFSLFTTNAYRRGESWAIEMNKTLSSRVALQEYYEETYEITVFGQELSRDALQKKPLDNGYYRILFNNGVLGLVALVIIIELSLKKSLKTDTYIFTILIMTLFYGLSEWGVFRVIMTPFWNISFIEAERKKDAKEDF